MLNALQANPENPTVTVRIADVQKEGGGLSVEVQDSGPGFPTDVAEEIGVPFHSTRSVGLGLGLTVTRKIIENHRGTLEIQANGAAGPGIIRVTLPKPVT
jgi:signal transduction histidine kinase